MKDRMIGDPALLLKLCEEAVANPEWKPESGVTHCNQAADYVATGLGCLDFRARDGTVLLADQIYESIQINGNWRPVTIGGTWVLASDGALVVGILPSNLLGESHGHISICIPGQPVWSGHWDSLAPLAMNVGKENFIGRPMSFAFKTMPKFFTWIDRRN